ncbi:murein hydrolase activator EnvC [Paenibacillus tarimensis]
MKKSLTFLAIIVLAAVVFQPIGGEASSEVDRINRELKKVRDEMKAAENRKIEAEKSIQELDRKKEETAKSINEIINQINDAVVNMQNVRDQIASTEDELQAAARNLSDAELRIEEREAMRQSILRLRYTNGFVSYVDVLFGSTSFADFLDRSDALQAIFRQEKELLDEQKRDREMIVVKKEEIETKLEEVNQLYDRLETYHAQLVNKEKEKERMILSFNQQKEEQLDISEEQEAQLMKLAKKASDLEKEKNRVETHYKGGKLLRPIGDGYRISSGFGPRTHPITGQKGKMHNGIDFAAPQGTPIYAAESGVVIVAQATSGYGNTVIIDHGGGLWTLYAHIRPKGILVESGQKVKRGDKIAEVGTTGNSTGPHLHFEVRLNEKPQNPLNYLR